MGALGGIIFLCAVLSRLLFRLFRPLAQPNYHPGDHHGWSQPKKSKESRCTRFIIEKRTDFRSRGRVGLDLGRVSTDLARVISEEEVDGASSMTWLSLEYIVFQLSRLPQGSIRTAGTLEVFFDFLIIVGDTCMSWASSTATHHCRDSLIYLWCHWIVKWWQLSSWQ